MGTRVYLKVYSSTGVVRKTDAKKMTCLYYKHLSNGIVTIPVAHEDIFIYYGTIDQNGRISYLIKNQELQ